MTETATFTSDKESLENLLNSIQRAKIQLPEFQRGWVWNDEHIKSLIASVSLSHPIGALMLLEMGNPDVKFKPRLLEGLHLPNPPEPETLILDGQQRMTSLYQAMKISEPARTLDSKGKKIKRWYYVDIEKALQYPAVDREEAIISVPEDRCRRNFRGEIIADYSSTKKECEHGLFPCNRIFDQVKLNEWQMEFLSQNKDEMEERLEKWNQFQIRVINPVNRYLIPLIILKRPTPKEAVCQVFEKVNTGGVTLTVFELLTASFASDEFNLREDWEKRSKKLQNNKKLGSVARILSAVQSDDYLQSLTLLSTFDKRQQAIHAEKSQEQAPGITCKRKDILRLTLDDYQKWADRIIDGFIKAGRFIFSQKIFNFKDLPYRTQLIPLAAIFAVLGDEADQVDARNKITRWYWCGVLGELYGGAIEFRFAQDLPEVLNWIAGGSEPRTVIEASFTRSRLYTLHTRNSAAYKGIYALLMRDGGADFISGEPIT
ncbi:MAG: GmrSD restriction endonuclease domain-containing protein, partial [Candidatus Hinthialibacter sp.]